MIEELDLHGLPDVYSEPTTSLALMSSEENKWIQYIETINVKQTGD
jgi:hypothetical protein